MGLGTFLRQRATANGSEVILPWFPEARGTDPASRLLRATRTPPPGPGWANALVALPLWIILSTAAALKVWRQHGRGVRQRTGVGTPRQLGQMLTLAWGRNVSPLDYYQFRYFEGEYRRRAHLFIPAVRLGRLERRLNRGLDTDLLDHKLRAYHAFTAAGLPTAQVVDVFYVDGRRELNRTEEDLASFVGCDLFVKPINGFGGAGVGRWLYDPAGPSYRNGECSVPAERIWEHFAREAVEQGKGAPARNARLVQPLLRNHPDLAPLSKAALNTLRVTTMSSLDGRIRVHAAVLRMALGEAVEDTSAGLASVLDLETGRMGPGTSLRLAEQVLSHHPDTGAAIEGRLCPSWDAVLALAFRAHECFAQIPFVGWDIAVTPEGPLLVEANTHPRLDLMQAQPNAPLGASAFAEFFLAVTERGERPNGA
jgi:hypothetical protein